MKNLAILSLPLCLWTGLAVGCDAGPAPNDDLESTPSGAELGVWPLPLPELAVQPRHAGATSYKAKHLLAGDDLAAAWTRWIMALPYSTGPVNDSTGAACAAGQHGKYWFLAGTPGGAAERACDVPADRHLVLPLLNWFCAFFPELYPDDEALEQGIAEMVGGAASLPDAVCELTLEVDGVDALADIDAFTELFDITEQAFEIDANDDHFAASEGFAGGTMPAVTAGYYVRLKPLAPGDHTIEFGGALCTDGIVDFETRTTYHLHVGP
jgi:hypothetical protein